ncbi:hypothetical protein LCGC14_2907950, partial [marine sediment metagenome]
MGQQLHTFLGEQITEVVQNGLFFVVLEFTGIEENSVAHRTAFIPDMGLLGVDHADHLIVADWALHVLHLFVFLT